MSASERLAQEIRRRVESMALRAPVVAGVVFVSYDFSWGPDPAVGVWSAFLPSPPGIFVINTGSMGISRLFPLSFLPVSTFAERWLVIAKIFGGGVWMRISTRVRGTIAVVALLFVPVSFARPQHHRKIKSGGKADINAIGNRTIAHGLNFYSLEREIALGSQLAREVDRSAKFIDDPLVKEYVNRIGQNLVRASDARVPFTFKVIDSEEVNAFALPGGFLYVNLGLILLADEESELARFHHFL